MKQPKESKEDLPPWRYRVAFSPGTVPRVTQWAVPRVSNMDLQEGNRRETCKGDHGRPVRDEPQLPTSRRALASLAPLGEGFQRSECRSEKNHLPDCPAPFGTRHSSNIVDTALKTFELGVHLLVETAK